MARPPKREASRPTRAELLILVKQQIERAGEQGISTAEILTALADTGISHRTLERILSDLRSKHDADLTCTGNPRRWRFQSRLALPLDAPDREDLLAMIHAIALAKPLVPPELSFRLTTIAEVLDERVRNYTAATDLPHHNALTSSFTHSMKTDHEVVTRLFLACRRQTVRILYVSPWQDSREPAWHEVEPWALDMHDGAYYLRAWAIASKRSRTFSVAHISEVEPLAVAPPRHPAPAKPWAEAGAGFGIDKDRPGVAVIRLRGRVARWVSSTTWHTEQKDVWPLPNELLERTIAFNSCRELARLLATVVDGIVSIEPPALRAEVIAHCAHAQTLLA